jgi:hypothetical protein
MSVQDSKMAIASGVLPKKTLTGSISLNINMHIEIQWKVTQVIFAIWNYKGL